jgi:hypothetical protein
MTRLLAVMIAAAVLLLLPAEAHAGGWTWPVEGRLVTTYRNGGDPYAAGQHRGIDIAAPVGSRVVAAAAGSVTFAGTVGDAGLTVSVRTGDGFDTSYLHLGSATVRRGERVEAGEAIGSVGTSGRRSASEPHLHFGVRTAGDRHAYRDPLALLPPPPVPRSPSPKPVPAPLSAGEPLRPIALPAPAPLAAPAPPPLTAPALLPLPRPAAVRAAATRESTRAAPSREPNALARGATALFRGGLLREPATVPPRDNAGASRTERMGPSAVGGRTAPGPVRQREAESDADGVDLGWLAACAGLVVTAFLLAPPAWPNARKRPASSIAACPTTSPRRSTT